jgi:phosphatidylcholine synthase
VRALAFSVHVLTALGAGIALMALDAAVTRDWGFMFGLLGAALVIDGVDGPLARALKVSERQPRWAGAVLDLVVDFTTYVFVPGYAIMSLVPATWGIVLGPLIVITGALYFANGNMKTDDNYFVGFPAVWNLIAFYLLMLVPPPWLTAVAVVAFAALQFTPMKFVHPLRVEFLRPLTLALTVLWAMLAIAALHADLQPEFWVKAALCAIALYFLLFGLLPGRRP